MRWIGITFNDPLILLRIYLGLIWAITGLYALWMWRFRKSPANPVLAYTVLASFLNAILYFLIAVATFSSGAGLMVIAALFTFTPFALILWIHYVDTLNKTEEAIQISERAVADQVQEGVEEEIAQIEEGLDK